MSTTPKFMNGKLIPEPGESRKALVKDWCEKITGAKTFWGPDFKRMREDMDFAYGLQYAGQVSLEMEDRYVANIVQRHLNQRTASLYAKNPTVIAERKPSMDFAIWDEDPAVIQNLAAMSSTGMPPPPEMALLAEDIAQGYQLRNLMKRVARTLEILWRYYTDEQTPPFKLMMKDTVRKALTCGVGYIEVDFQRSQGFSEERMSALADARGRMQQLQRLMAEMEMGPDEDGYCEADSEVEQLKLIVADIQANPDLPLREGLVYDFPEPLSIIPSPSTKMLRGWYGTEWVAKEMIVPCNKIKDWFGIDIGSQYSEYSEDGENAQVKPPGAYNKNGPKDKFVCMWKVYSKPDGLVFYLVDGYDDFLREPEKPAVSLERFFPFYVLTFNEVTHYKKVYPISDVRLLRSMQLEYNRKKEALRQHRIANRPVYATPAGSLGEEDKDKLMCDYPDHAILELNGLKEGQDVKTVLQPVQKAPIDPNIYETDSDFNDILRVVGSQEAQLGGTSGDTATEVSVAEGSRVSSVASNEDDLEQTMTEMALDGGKILLLNVSEETVKKICGPGAAWPKLSPEDIRDEIFLRVEAGTAGRPNRAQDLSNLERAAPLLVQIPGIDPEAIGKYALRLLDDRLDIAEFIKPGMPSILAQNAQAKGGAGGPAGSVPPPPGSDPTVQGSQGGANAAAPPQAPGGSQPAYPSGTEPGLGAGNVAG
jgi:hypothetical protein